MIKVSKKVLNNYVGIIERATILISDNKPLKDLYSFYDDDLVLCELNTMLKDFQEVLK